MALAPADFIYPPDGTGELRPSWFEEGELAASLPVWIDAGTSIVPVGASEVQADAVVRSYVYWQGYEAKALAIAGTPDSVALDGLSRTTSTSRAKVFLDKAAEWRTVYEALLADLAAPAPEPVVTSRVRESSVIPLSISW